MEATNRDIINDMLLILLFLSYQLNTFTMQNMTGDTAADLKELHYTILSLYFGEILHQFACH